MGILSVSAMSFVCSWACVAFSPSKHSMAPPPMVSNCSFAQALLGRVNVSLTQLPKPCLEGNCLSMKIYEDVYQIGLANFNNYLHER
jgi:hypothetical protein